MKYSLACHVVAACIGIALAIITRNNGDILQSIFLVVAGGMFGVLKLESEEDKQ